MNVLIINKQKSYQIKCWEVTFENCPLGNIDKQAEKVPTTEKIVRGDKRFILTIS